MEVRTTFRGSAVSKKGFGAALMAVIVVIGALLAISLASVWSAKPSVTTPAGHGIAAGTAVGSAALIDRASGQQAAGTTSGSAALTDRESGQPAAGSNYVGPHRSNGHGQLP